MKYAVILISCSFLFVSCQKKLLNLQKEIVLKRQAKLKSFSGTMRELKVYGGKDVTYQVYFKRPHHFAAKVTSKGALKNIQYIYHGDSLKMYFPAKKFGYHFVNLPTFNAKEQVNYVTTLFDYYTSAYKPKLIEASIVADKETAGIHYEPLASNNAYLGSLTANVYEPFALPLKSKLHLGKRTYTTYFEQIQFNQKISAKKFKLSIPRGATITKIDYNSTNLTRKKLRARANFRAQLPSFTEGLTLKRIVKAKSFIPGFTAHYQKTPFEFYVSMVKDYGIQMIPLKGLKVKGKNTYYVSLLGIYTMVYFKKKGVHYNVHGNIPPARLLIICDSFEGL